LSTTVPSARREPGDVPGPPAGGAEPRGGHASGAGPRGAALELLAAAGWLAVVLVVAAIMLATLDGVPAWINGESRDVRPARSLEEAEQRVRARLVLPAYFPDTLAWPPERIRVLPGKPPAVSLTLTGRDGAEARLVLAQTIGPGELSDRLLPVAGALDESPVALPRAEGGQGRLRRVVGPDGAIWRELSWTQAGRSLVARSKGSLEELLRMARSAREQP
jgi:hypothetical protein